MARKKKHPEHVNHERWLVSYADFITLLFAFFVVMFAVSQVDSKKVGRFTEAFSKAVGIDVFPMSGVGLMAGSEYTASQDTTIGAGNELLPHELEGLKASLKKSAVKMDEMKGLQILQRRNEIVLRLPENVVFASGDDSVKPAAERALHVIAHELAPRPVDVRIEGHTDNRPIRTARFRSNWDLSTARATAVIVSLAKDGIASERLAAAGYGEFRPVAPNTSDEGRRLNRRVDLVVSLSRPVETLMPADDAKDADAGAEANAEAHADADAGVHAEADAGVHAEADAGAHAEAEAHAEADAHDAGVKAEAHSHGHDHGHEHAAKGHAE